MVSEGIEGTSRRRPLGRFVLRTAGELPTSHRCTLGKTTRLAGDVSPYPATSAVRTGAVAAVSNGTGCWPAAVGSAGTR